MHDDLLGGFPRLGHRIRAPLAHAHAVAVSLAAHLDLAILDLQAFQQAERIFVEPMATRNAGAETSFPEIRSVFARPDSPR